MTLCIRPMPRMLETWFFDVASAYFHELVPDGPALPREEVTEWFTDPDGHPIVIEIAQHRVGFAMIEAASAHHELSEFCILPEWRNQGLGRKAAAQCFDRFPGPWALGIAKQLPGTARFWDRLLAELPGITGLARGQATTPFQSHSYSFHYKGAS